MDINIVISIVQLTTLVLMIVSYRWHLKRSTEAVDHSVKQLTERRKEHEHALSLISAKGRIMDKELERIKAEQVNLEYQIAKYKKMTPEKIGEAMDTYQEVHTLMKQTLHDEAYEYVLANNPQEAELVFTWVLKNGYTVINTSTSKEPLLNIMNGVDHIIVGNIRGIYNEKLVRK